MVGSSSGIRHADSSPLNLRSAIRASRLALSSARPGGTKKAHPSSRPGKLPRVRRGMNRPGSISSHGSGAAPASGLDWLNLDLPPLRRRHTGAVGVPPHETTGWRSVGNENHTLWDLPFDTREGRLAK